MSRGTHWGCLHRPDVPNVQFEHVCTGASCGYVNEVVNVVSVLVVCVVVVVVVTDDGAGVGASDGVVVGATVQSVGASVGGPPPSLPSPEPDADDVESSPFGSLGGAVRHAGVVGCAVGVVGASVVGAPDVGASETGDAVGVAVEGAAVAVGAADVGAVGALVGLADTVTVGAPDVGALVFDGGNETGAPVLTNTVGAIETVGADELVGGIGSVGASVAPLGPAPRRVRRRASGAVTASFVSSYPPFAHSSIIAISHSSTVFASPDGAVSALIIASYHSFNIGSAAVPVSVSVAAAAAAAACTARGPYDTTPTRATTTPSRLATPTKRGPVARPRDGIALSPHQSGRCIQS
jgi:hypothetical protein